MESVALNSRWSFTSNDLLQPSGGLNTKMTRFPRDLQIPNAPLAVSATHLRAIPMCGGVHMQSVTMVLSIGRKILCRNQPSLSSIKLCQQLGSMKELSTRAKSSCFENRWKDG